MDFGVFVFSPDDTVTLRELTSSTQRDNVLLEFGIFLGALGRERAFFVLPKNSDQHLPTDLLGITPLLYDKSRADKEPVPALGTACIKVGREIQRVAEPLQSMTTHQFQVFLQGTSWLKANKRERLIFLENGLVSYVNLSNPEGWVERYSFIGEPGTVFVHWRHQGRLFDAKCEFNKALTEFEEVNSYEDDMVWRRMEPKR